ncbi:MAG: DUF3109 family protein [Ignavibacteria bacterium]|nr:DUF3109 family protein [Ignavibacteria bacterium]MBI3765489.1 DUF3109 family protein [Ignavibacteriales bacterium]
MFVIGEAIVEEDLVHQPFVCDLDGCKGACCTLPGGRGAPLEDNEVQEIEQAYPKVKKYLSSRHMQAIEKLGMFEGGPGNFATACIDNKECVFVFYEDGIARCSFEKAFLRGETSWRKPLSCHLFPVRISKGVVERVRYEEIPECSPALRQGSLKDVRLYEFLKDPLIRKFGESWYNEFERECRRREPIRNAKNEVVPRLKSQVNRSSC